MSESPLGRLKRFLKGEGKTQEEIQEEENQKKIQKLLTKLGETSFDDFDTRNHLVGQLQQLGYPNAALLLNIG
jgi:hypothetical protein